MTQNGTIPTIKKNEFKIKGTIFVTDTLADGKHNPTFVKIFPDSVEQNPLFSHVRGKYDDVYFSHTPQSVKQGRLLKNGDCVEIICYINAGEAYIATINKIE